MEITPIFPIIWFSVCFLIKNICKAQHTYLYKGSRGCQNIETELSAYHVSLWMLIFMVVLISLICLLLLGLMKGLMGLLCCAPVGMWGIGTLIDLPRPLGRYQERELAHIPVQYDITGWPVHPETGQRSVRALTKKTEFYLNIIFFLTYPLAMIVTMCSACCFKETEDCDDQCYKCVNTIVFTDCSDSTTGHKRKKKKKVRDDIYCDEDSAEDKDTHYVVCQMHHSQQSLQVNK